MGDDAGKCTAFATLELYFHCAVYFLHVEEGVSFLTIFDIN